MAGTLVSLWLKVTWTAMVLVIVLIYWRHRGPANFLWFSDIALLALVAGLWLESSFIVSLTACMVLVPEMLWIVSFFGGLLGLQRLIGLADYMYDKRSAAYMARAAADARADKTEIEHQSCIPVTDRCGRKPHAGTTHAGADDSVPPRSENPRVGSSSEPRSGDRRTKCARRVSEASPFCPWPPYFQRLTNSKFCGSRHLGENFGPN